MERAQKQAEIEFLTDQFSRANIALLADYRGLNVAEISNLRRELRRLGVIAKVVKNRLANQPSVKR